MSISLIPPCSLLGDRSGPSDLWENVSIFALIVVKFQGLKVAYLVVQVAGRETPPIHVLYIH